jgi:hypothetical protein
MKDFDEPGFLAPTGLFLGPTKYMVIQGEPGAVIRGKKVRTDPSSMCSPSRSPSINARRSSFSCFPRDLEA